MYRLCRFFVNVVLINRSSFVKSLLSSRVHTVPFFVGPFPETPFIQDLVSLFGMWMSWSVRQVVSSDDSQEHLLLHLIAPDTI